MAIYRRNVPGMPPWVTERADVMGWGTMASVMRSLAATATSHSDTTNATFFTALSSKIEASAGADPSGASARLTFMVISKK